MLDRDRLKAPGLGFGLLFLTAFLTLSLVGYDPADPPGTAVDPPNQPVANPCGPVGATLAHLAFQTVGWASFLPLYALTVTIMLIARRRAMERVGAAWLGLAVLTIVLASVFQSLRPDLFPSVPIGSGGDVGGLVVALLEDLFGPVGMGLALSAAALLGLRLGGDLLFRAPARELLAAWRVLRGPRHRAHPLDRIAPYAQDLVALSRADSLAHADPREIRPALSAPLASSPEPPRRPLPVVTRAPHARSPIPIPAGSTYVPPPLELLEPPAGFPIQEHESLVQQRALVLEKALREHGCIVRVVQIDTGPVITMFEVELEAGLRVSKILGLSSDLAIALAVPSVRIVYPLPGKTTVGIEVPNERRAMVQLGEVMAMTLDEGARMQIPLFLGKDVKGIPLAYDLARMPHLLIAGRTGTGKSVCLNTIILSILMTRRPDEVKLILIDPKKVELSQFRRIPHLMHPVVTEMDKAEALLAWACEKMEERYALLERARVRSIKDYNALGAEELYARLQIDQGDEAEKVPTFLHAIVIIADEMADLVMTASKDVETHIVRLAQKARAAGIHLILATQRPTVDVITGLIKGNMPARIAFQVTSRNDSRVVLDEMGADKLLGNGDMLFLVPGTSNLIRAQGTYVSDAEVNRICGYLEQYPLEFSKELTKLHLGPPGGKDKVGGLKQRDELYEPAVEITLREGKGSTSLLQRALGIGYGRAARLIDYMAEDGIVGVSKGSVARDVLFTWEEWEAMKAGNAARDGTDTD
jgi:S-DNA-T family DNA segregation ATPase FtsK/SpoIIIE